MILIVEVDGWTRGTLPYQLTQAGHVVRVVQSLENALDMLEHEPLALLIVGGWADSRLYRSLRQATPAPILALAPQTDEKQMLVAFDAGVDDYQAGFISCDEVVMRVQAVLRRIRKTRGDAATSGPACLLHKTSLVVPNAPSQNTTAHRL